MSFCPTNCPSDDIHSLYIDKELPEIYKAEYEEHIKTCHACQAKLKKIQVLHQLFNDDSEKITPDSKFMDESFQRLQLKMRYNSNIVQKKKVESSYRTRYLIPSVAAVAAAFLVAVVLPTNLKSSLNPGTQSVASHNVVSKIPTATDVSLGGGRSVVISGNIQGTSVLPASAKENTVAMDVVNSRAMTVIPATNNDHFIKNYEVFSPDIGNEEKISIRITVPGVNTAPVFTEIELPLNVIMGQN